MLAALLPRGLNLQTFDGSAWLALVPFRMAGVMRRPLPDLPGFSAFPELNLRTYVEAEGKPGVWFFSLDAESWPIVLGGRHVYGLPYFRAAIRHRRCGVGVDFDCRRRCGGAEFVARIRPTGRASFAAPGTLEYWAAERYCLYSCSARRGLERVEVHHPPWPLQTAEVEVARCRMFEPAGLALEPAAPVCHFSSGVDVVSYAGERVGAG